jgi:hypothetical protein
MSFSNFSQKCQAALSAFSIWTRYVWTIWHVSTIKSPANMCSGLVVPLLHIGSHAERMVSLKEYHKIEMHGSHLKCIDSHDFSLMMVTHSLSS